MTNDSSSDSPLVVVATFVSAIEAEVARSALDAAGIDALIRRDDCGGERPSLWLGGVALLVARDDAAEAADILHADTQNVDPDN